MVELRKVGARLGQLPLSGDKPDRSATRTSIVYGASDRAGLLIKLYGVTFYDPGEGVPALVDWLCKQGCTRLTYDFHRHNSGFDDPAENEEDL